MMTHDDRMFDLTLRPLADGGFELAQLAGGLEEPDRIMLHPCQVRLLAERAGLLTPDPTPRLSARHVARIHALRRRLDDLDNIYRDEIIDRCGSGIEISLHLEAIADLVYELIEDIGADPAEQCNAATVTSSTQGNEARHDPAERGASPRAKRAEPATAHPDLLSISIDQTQGPKAHE